MRHEVVHVTNSNVHVYGGKIIERVCRFNEKYELPQDPQYAFVELTQQMSVNNPHTLVQAILDDEDKLVGHCITMAQELYGKRAAMIYQLEIDEEARGGREEMLKSGWNQIVAFAQNCGCTSVRAWAMNPKLAEVFERFGLKKKPYTFVETEI